MISLFEAQAVDLFEHEESGLSQIDLSEQQEIWMFHDRGHG